MRESAANVGQERRDADDVSGDSRKSEGRADVSRAGGGEDVASDGPTQRQLGRMESNIAWLVKGQENLWKALADFRKEMNERFVGLEGRIQGLEGKIRGLEDRIRGLEDRIRGLEEKFHALDKRMYLLIFLVVAMGLMGSDAESPVWRFLLAFFRGGG